VYSKHSELNSLSTIVLGNCACACYVFTSVCGSWDEMNQNHTEVDT